jgi:hypothetical protein
LRAHQSGQIFLPYPERRDIEMNRIFTALRRFLSELTAPATPVDAISAMSPRDYADLPVYHPRLDN